MNDLKTEEKGIALNVELVGIKNLKTTHNWRLEFDVFEIDTHKVKNLMDKINKALVMALVDEKIGGKTEGEWSVRERL